MARDVVIFTTPGCTSCERAKAFLRAHSVMFLERNLTDDSRAMEELVALGVRMLPVVRIGDEIVSGFDPVRLSKTLGLPAEGA